MAAVATIGMSDAKANFSRITAEVNRTGVPVTVFKNNRPWVEIRPLASEPGSPSLPEETMEAMREAEAMLADPGHATCRSVDDLFAQLES